MELNLGKVVGNRGVDYVCLGTVTNISELPPANTMDVGVCYYVGSEPPRKVYRSDGLNWINKGEVFHCNRMEFPFELNIDSLELNTGGILGYNITGSFRKVNSVIALPRAKLAGKIIIKNSTNGELIEMNYIGMEENMFNFLADQLFYADKFAEYGWEMAGGIIAIGVDENTQQLSAVLILIVKTIQLVELFPYEIETIDLKIVI